MSLPKQRADQAPDVQVQDVHSTQTKLEAETATAQHELVSALRGILTDPAQHTVGALAVAVERGLAELNLLKDRLDLIALDTAGDTNAALLKPAPDMTPGSGSVGEVSAPGAKG